MSIGAMQINLFTAALCIYTAGWAGLSAHPPNTCVTLLFWGVLNQLPQNCDRPVVTNSLQSITDDRKPVGQAFYDVIAVLPTTVNSKTGNPPIGLHICFAVLFWGMLNQHPHNCDWAVMDNLQSITGQKSVGQVANYVVTVQPVTVNKWPPSLWLTLRASSHQWQGFNVLNTLSNDPIVKKVHNFPGVVPLKF